LVEITAYDGTNLFYQQVYVIAVAASQQALLDLLQA